MLVSLAFRNLFRNLRRTLITSVAVTFGVAIIIVGFGLVDGLDENYLRASRTTATGDVVLRPADYPTDGMDLPLDQAVPVGPDLAAKLDATGPWTSRLLWRGRLVKGVDATRATGVGFDPAKETAVFSREGWAVKGAWPAAGAGEVAIGELLAKLLRIEPGDEIVFEARTRAGAVNALSYEVSALVRSDNAMLDQSAVWMRMEDARALVAVGDERTHVAVLTRDAAGAKAALAGHGWTPSTLHDEVADMLEINVVRRKALSFLVLIIMGIAATGIANTVIMSVYERIREIGTLMAMGLRKAEVRNLFLLEGAVMGVAAGTAGAALGAAFVAYFEEHGFDIGSTVVENSGDLAVSAYLYTKLSPGPVLIALAFGVGVAVLASVWPARFASRLNPADAVRAD